MRVRDHSMKGLRALEAVARLGSVVAAARELNVSPGAVTHRISALENIAGECLLERHQGRFVPTGKGRLLMDAIGSAFSMIHAAQTILDGDKDDVSLSILAPSSFASEWLLPRLTGFGNENPSVKLRLQPDDAPWRKSETQKFDIVIQDAVDAPDERDWKPMFRDPLMVVGTPELLARVPHFSSAAWLEVPLIHTETDDWLTSNVYGWDKWRQAKGLPELTGGTQTTTVFTQAKMAILAATRGDGLTLATRSLVIDHLNNGTLAVLDESEINGPTYWVSWVTRSSKTGRLCARFTDWLQSMAVSDNLTLNTVMDVRSCSVFYRQQTCSSPPAHRMVNTA